MATGHAGGDVDSGSGHTTPRKVERPRRAPSHGMVFEARGQDEITEAGHAK